MNELYSLGLCFLSAVEEMVLMPFPHSLVPGTTHSFADASPDVIGCYSCVFMGFVANASFVFAVAFKQ